MCWRVGEFPQTRTSRVEPLNPVGVHEDSGRSGDWPALPSSFHPESSWSSMGRRAGEAVEGGGVFAENFLAGG